MKRCFSFMLMILALASVWGGGKKEQTVPPLSGRVNDIAGVMKVSDREAAENYCAALEAQTGAQIAVLTVNSYAEYGYGSMDDFSLATASAWKLGQAGKDNGILLAVAVKERRVKIEVGYGLEGALPDSAAGRLLDESVVPYLKNNDYSGGVVSGVLALANAVAKETGTAAIVPAGSVGGSQGLATSAETAEKKINPAFFIILGFAVLWVGVLVFIIVMAVTHRGKGGVSTAGTTVNTGRGRTGFSGGGGGFSGGGGSFGGGGAGRGF
jgi:uncharacterized protein